MEDIINVYEELEKILDIHGKDEKRFQHFDKKSVEVVRVSDDGQVATVERAKAIVRIRDNVDVSDEDLAIYKSQCEKLGGYFDEKEKAFVFDKDFNGYYQETLAKLFAGTPIEEMMQGKWNMHGGYKSPADKNRTNELQEGFMRNKLRELEDYEYLFDPRIDEMVAKYYGNGTILTEGRLFIELDKEATARIQSVPGYEGYKQFELTFTEEGLNSLNKVKLGYVVSYPDGRYEIKTEPQPTEEKDMLLALVNGDNSNGIKTRNVDGEEMVSLKYRDINKFCEDIEKIVDYQKNLDNQREEQKESNIKNALDEIMKRLNTFDQYTRKEDFKKAYDNFMQIDVKETPLLYQEEGPGSRVVFHMTTSSKEKWQKYVEIAKTVGGHYEKGVGFVFDKPFLGYDHRTIARLFVGEDVNSVMMGNLNYDGEGSYDTHYRQNPELNEGFMRKKLRMQVQIPRPDMAALAGRFEFIYNREETTRLPQTEEEASFANNRNLYFDLYVEGGRVGHVISRTDGSYQIKTEPKDAEFAGDLKTLRSEYCDVLKVGDKVSLVYKDVNRFKKDFKKIEEVYQEIAAKNSEGESVGEGYGQVKEKDGEAQTAGVSDTGKTIEADDKENGLVKGKDSVREAVESDEEEGLVKEKEASETSNVNEHDDDTVQEDVSVPNDGQIHFPDEEPAAGTEKPAGENVGLVKEKDGADEEAVGEDKTAGMSEEESPLSDKDQGEEVDAREENGLVSDKEAGEGISAEDTKAGKVFGTSKAAGTTKTTSAAEANAEGGANETKEQTNKQTNKNRHGKDDNNPGGSAHEASDRDDNSKGGEGVSNGQGGIRQEHEADDPLSDSVVGTPQPSVDGDRGTLGGLPEPDKEGAVVRRDGGRQTGDGGMGDSEGHGSTREGIDGGIPSVGGPQGGPSGILPGAADKLRQDKGDDDGKRGTGVDGGHADTGDDYLSLYTNRTDGGRLTGQNANAYLQKTSPEKSGSKENIAIMELLADILEANRSATPEERAELARYSGWGGKNDFYDYQTTDRIREVCKRLEPYTKTINAAYTANRLYNEIYSSTLNAYYTPNEIVDAIQHFVKKAGFEASLDIAFSAVGFIGPFGAGISAGYFLVKTGYTIYKSNKE